MSRFVEVVCTILVACGVLLAQTSSITEQVPRVVRFSGVAKDESGKPLSGTLGVTFLLYKNQEGGSPLWMEMQNLQADSSGHYTVMLGSATPDGIPVALFSSAEVHWISTQISGQKEQPRLPLLSVPYALKAADAETLGGLPASAFVQANPHGAVAPSIATPSSSTLSKPVSPTPSNSPAGNVPQPATITGAGTTNFLPLWTSASNIGNSILFQTGGNVGVATKTPGAKLDTTGTAIAVRGSSSGATGTGVSGKVTSTTGVNFGVQGTTPSTAKGSAGVEGISSATTGFSTGVLGTSASPNAPAVLAHATGLNATGVLGEALNTTAGITITPKVVNSTTVPQIGVEGTASSSQGIGVVGISSQWGMFGESTAASPNAQNWLPAGVFGYAPGVTSTTYGVQGLSDSPTGSGVFGSTSSLTGMNFGVNGVSNSGTNLSAGVNGYESATSGQVFGVDGVTNSSGTYSAGVAGSATSPDGQVFGVNGATNSTGNGAAGVNGYEGATSGQVYGVAGNTSSTTNFAAGVTGFEGATTGVVFGVSGSTNSTTDGAAAVNGYQGAATGQVFGVSGVSNSTSNFSAGVVGNHLAASGIVMGVLGQSNSSSDAAAGVVGVAASATGTTHAIRGIVNSPQGISGLFMARSTGIVLDGFSYTGPGSNPVMTEVFRVDGAGNGIFNGNLNVSGKLTKGSGSFKIDHPLDPANKYLSHSFVESPDMMNVYNGNITTDNRGLATVTLPDYFGALNRDFRYQLTVIGRFAQAIVLREIRDNHFVIKTNKPGVKVSWQVTGIRQDAYANANRIPVEEVKSPKEQGHYLHPELFGAGSDKAINVPAPEPSTAPDQTAALPR